MAIIKFSKKHKIKEDRFIESVFELRQKAQDYKKHLLIGLGILVFVGLVTVLVYKIRTRTNQEANALFGTALIEYQQGRYSDAIAKLKQISDNFSGSTSAPKAMFLYGSLYYDLGNYQLAVEAFKKYIEKYNDADFLDPTVYKGLGSAYMQLGDFKQAVQAFSDAVGRYPKDFQVPELLYKQARCHLELKDTATAKTELERIISEFPKSAEARQAGLLLASL